MYGRRWTCRKSTSFAYAVSPLTCGGHPYLRVETPKHGVQAEEISFFLDFGLFFWPLVGMTVHSLARGGFPHLRRQVLFHGCPKNKRPILGVLFATVGKRLEYKGQQPTAIL